MVCLGRFKSFRVFLGDSRAMIWHMNIELEVSGLHTRCALDRALRPNLVTRLLTLGSKLVSVPDSGTS